MILPIHTSVLAPRPTAAVWEQLSNLERHIEWMSDAVDVGFVGTRRRGVGTRMVVDTKLGMFRLTDHLEVIGWVDGRSITVSHTGRVAGKGELRLDGVAGGTRVSRVECLSFPWKLGGPITALGAAVVLSRIWARDLASFRDLVERSSSLEPR